MPPVVSRTRVCRYEVSSKEQRSSFWLWSYCGVVSTFHPAPCSRARYFVCAIIACYKSDRVNGRWHRDLSPTRSFGGMSSVANHLTCLIQSYIPHPPNSSTTLPGKSSFSRSKVAQSAGGSPQPERSASVPHKQQRPATRGNSPAKPHQVALFADVERAAEHYLMLLSE